MVERGELVHKLEAIASRVVLLPVTDPIQVHIVIVVIKARAICLGRENLGRDSHGLIHLKVSLSRNRVVFCGNRCDQRRLTAKT